MQLRLDTCFGHEFVEQRLHVLDDIDVAAEDLVYRELRVDLGVQAIATTPLDQMRDADGCPDAAQKRQVGQNRLQF